MISSGLVDSIMNLINESWPYSGMALGIVGLGALHSLLGVEVEVRAEPIKYKI